MKGAAIIGIFLNGRNSRLQGAPKCRPSGAVAGCWIGGTGGSQIASFSYGHKRCRGKAELYPEHFNHRRVEETFGGGKPKKGHPFGCPFALEGTVKIDI